MNRLLVAAASLALLSACIVVPVAGEPDTSPAPAPRPPPPRVTVVETAPEVWYYGPHFIPEDRGGGWCYEDGAHTHDYYPDHPDAYVVERGYYSYAGPSVFTYYEGHPLPGGGWCTIRGPHTHEFYPPPRAGFSWHQGRGYVYEGAYRSQRPPPPAFWPRPTVVYRAPPPARLPAAPAPRPGAPRASPAPARDGFSRDERDDRRAPGPGDERNRDADRDHDRARPAAGLPGHDALEHDHMDRGGPPDRTDDRARQRPGAVTGPGGRDDGHARPGAAGADDRSRDRDRSSPADVHPDARDHGGGPGGSGARPGAFGATPGSGDRADGRGGKAGRPGDRVGGDKAGGQAKPATLRDDHKATSPTPATSAKPDRHDAAQRGGSRKDASSGKDAKDAASDDDRSRPR